MDGWIKLHRELLDHWIYKDSEYLKVWIEMLIRARYWDEPAIELIGDQLVKVERGEFIFGRPKWSKRLGISEQRLRTLLTKLIKDDMIEPVQNFPRFTLYRIQNYEKFNQQTNQQSNQQEIQQQQGFDGDGNQQDNQHSNQRPTSSQPAPNQQPTNNKERSNKEKNVENEKEEKPLSPKSPKRTYSEDDRFYKLAKRFHELAYENATEIGTAHLIEKPNLQKWANTFRLMIEKNKWSEAEIGEVVKFALKVDSFYQTIIFSPDNLRKHYQSILTKMKTQGGGGNGKYQRKSNGPTQESRSNASRNEDLYIGSTIGEDEPISEELLQRIRG